MDSRLLMRAKTSVVDWMIVVVLILPVAGLAAWHFLALDRSSVMPPKAEEILLSVKLNDRGLMMSDRGTMAKTANGFTIQSAAASADGEAPKPMPINLGQWLETLPKRELSILFKVYAKSTDEKPAWFGVGLSIAEVGTYGPHDALAGDKNIETSFMVRLPSYTSRNTSADLLFTTAYGAETADDGSYPTVEITKITYSLL